MADVAVIRVGMTITGMKLFVIMALIKSVVLLSCSYLIRSIFMSSADGVGSFTSRKRAKL